MIKCLKYHYLILRIIPTALSQLIKEKQHIKNAINYNILCLDSNLNFQFHLLHKLAILSSIIFLLKSVLFWVL